MRLRQVLTNLAVLAVSLIIGVTVAEAMLRMTDSRWELERRFFADKPEGIVYQRLENGLHALAASQRAEGHAACFSGVPVTINAQGFRGGKPISRSEPIVLLGDSFAEALQVPDGLTLADRLGQASGWPVINSGVSGYATTHELQAWRQRLKNLHPKVAILMVYLGNDISGNSCRLSKTEPPCGKVEGGRVRYMEAMPTPVSAPKETGLESLIEFEGRTAQDIEHIRKLLRRRLALYGLAHDLKMALQGLLAEVRGKVDTRWGLYRPAPDERWEEAWLITGDLLATLKREIEADGAKLVLALIPEPVTLLGNPRSAIRFGSGSAAPADLDMELPSKRLMAMAGDLGIPALDLLAVFKAYRDRHALAAPYFSFSCDGHWNPLGHTVAAAALADFLKPFGVPAPREGQLDMAMARAPQEHLGIEAFQQIYRGGIYQPKAAAE